MTKEAKQEQMTVSAHRYAEMPQWQMALKGMRKVGQEKHWARHRMIDGMPLLLGAIW